MVVEGPNTSPYESDCTLAVTGSYNISCLITNNFHSQGNWLWWQISRRGYFQWQPPAVERVKQAVSGLGFQCRGCEESPTPHLPYTLQQFLEFSIIITYRKSQ